jgi:Tol biopolymer transport system component
MAEAAPGDVELVSVTPLGISGNSGGTVADVSQDARFVAFISGSTDIVPNDSNGLKLDVFVRDRQSGQTELVTVSTGGQQANSDTNEARITPDGRYVVFLSEASNLAPDDTNGGVFVRDRQAGVTERVSIPPNGGQFTDFASVSPTISDDGRYVAFLANAGTFIGAYVGDRQTARPG